MPPAERPPQHRTPESRAPGPRSPRRRPLKARPTEAQAPRSRASRPRAAVPGQPSEGFIRLLRRSAWTIVALGILSFLIVGANRPANPSLLPPDGYLTSSGLPGFGTARLSVTPGYGLQAAAGGCVLVASTPAAQATGLMGQTSLHGFAGMAFRFASQTQTSFYMKDTLVPLTVAWFGADGAYLVSVDMEPCPTTQTICPTYGPGVPYQLALEVPRGKLGSLGIGPGSVLHLGGSCTA